MGTCCANSGNFCYNGAGNFRYCYDETAAASFLFGLGPELPARFGLSNTASTRPSNGRWHYLTVSASQWPIWGDSDLQMAGSVSDPGMGPGGPPGVSGRCNQGGTYEGSLDQVCGGGDNWGETWLQVWAAAPSHDGLSSWGSGAETATRRPNGGTFTLYKLPPHSSDFANTRDGAADYAAVCARYGMVGVGCGIDGGVTYGLVDEFGGMCMPEGWSCNLSRSMYEKTGWASVVFFGGGDPIYGVAADGGQTNSPPGGGFSPVCALAN